jgi:hypothetical protein
MRFTLIVSAFLLLASLVGAAHIFRYVPINTNDAFDFISVRDRWEHRVCVISLARGNRMLCTMPEVKAILPQ